MSELAMAIEAAARLPLNDAAYLLWKRKLRIDHEEQCSGLPQMGLRSLPLEDAEFGRLVHQAIAKVHWERENAHNGATFARLKAAHPGSGDADLRNAIGAAVKLDVDCLRHFSYSDSESLFTDAERAVARARVDSPDFLDSTYLNAAHDLCIQMR
ncbi:MAG: hypothetical protein GY844_29045 [Bradyrhizobium sp.]|nr:hypothetical protein [Bradyrhizobium sp.]